MIKYVPGDGWEYSETPDASPLDQGILKYAAEAYGFLLNTSERRRQAFTYAQFAEMIEGHYAATPQRDEVLRVLRTAPEPEVANA